MLRRRITYSGRVQGVGFRATACSIASRHPVTGWVRNDPEGSVTAEIQGQVEAVEAFLNDLRRAVGTLIHSEQGIEMAPQEGEQGFEIRR